jgi:hypothetical protein
MSRFSGGGCRARKRDFLERFLATIMGATGAVADFSGRGYSHWLVRRSHSSVRTVGLLRAPARLARGSLLAPSLNLTVDELDRLSEAIFLLKPLSQLHC